MAASSLAQFAAGLRAGVAVRIERTRPTWAAGWIEDVTLESGGLGELYQYLREEWGGKTYRVQVLLPNGAPAYEGRIEIAGLPLWEGEPIDRSEWNGDPGRRERERREDQNRTIPPARTRNEGGADLGLGAGGMIELFKLIMKTQADANDRQISAMRTLQETAAAQNQDLISAMLESRRPNSGPSLVQQLGELEQAKRALDKMGRVFGAAERSEPADDGMGSVLNEAAKEMFKSALVNEIAPKIGTQPKRHSTQQPAPISRPSHVRPVRTPGTIPNAHTGQRRPA